MHTDSSYSNGMSLAALMSTLQWSDTAFPSGRYTLSHGLEGLDQRGLITTEDQASKVLQEYLLQVMAVGDAPVSALAHRYAGYYTASASASCTPPDLLEMTLGRIINLDRALTATKAAPEMRLSSTRVGKQMLVLWNDVENVDGPDSPAPSALTAPSAELLRSYHNAVLSKTTPGNQAVVAGLIHAAHGLEEKDALTVELLGLALGWSSAALRLRLCDHIGAQRMVTHAQPTIQRSLELAQQHADYIHQHGLEILGQAAQNLDVASALHQRAPARLFLN